MIISVASGQGGTGKTVVATSLALSFEGRPVQFLDGDVEVPEAHLFLKPSFRRREKVAITIPRVNKAKCDYCGRCGQACAFNAIVVFARNLMTFPELCRGCGACRRLCPQHAITSESRQIGEIETGDADGVAFAHGRLAAGELTALPIIKKLKEKIKSRGTVIIDAAAGTSRPVVETINDSDFCLLVAEPTPIGRGALMRAAAMLKQLHLPGGVVIDGAATDDNPVAEYCQKNRLPVLLTIPRDIATARLGARGITLVQGRPDWQPRFTGLFHQIRGLTRERNRHPQR